MIFVWLAIVGVTCAVVAWNIGWSEGYERGRFDMHEQMKGDGDTMSYVRFGTLGSEVYVFFNCDGFYECCGCIMLGHAKPGTRVKTANEMLEHLRQHQRRGHVVPEHCINALLEEFWEEKRRN